MNNSASSHTVASTSGTGYAVAASDGVVRCTISNGNVIPPRGHFLCVNSIGYSLASYPAGNGTPATGDATYTTGIDDNAVIALFDTNLAANFSLATRLDAVGSTNEGNALYKEGEGYPFIDVASADQTFFRDRCGKQGSSTTAGSCPLGGAVVDTNDNAADFVYGDPDGTPVTVQRRGAPGPKNLSSPRHEADILWRNANTGGIFVWLLDGTSVTSTGFLGAVGFDWAIVGVGDFNADGRTDVLWRHTTTGQVSVWLMNGTSVATSGSPGTAGTAWSIARVSDVNGDGKDDLVWRNPTTGRVVAWLLNGTGFVTSGSLGVVGPEWVVQ